jgi:opacity protein-like surface antigen
VSNNGTVLNDQGGVGADWIRAVPYQYSKNSAGFQAGYNFARWVNGKFDFNWSRTHRDIPQVPGGIQSLNANEIKIGPTVDIKPLNWLLFRASYYHSWRKDPGYNATREMVFLTERNRNKVSLFSEISPWETFSFNVGFDYIHDDFPEDRFGVESAYNYSPSIGFTYTPVEWLKFFADYNFDGYRWNQPFDATITSRGKDKINTFSLGSDVQIIKNQLGFRIQYGFSQALSQISNKDTTNPGVQDPNWPSNSNTWHELLARLEYQVHKNVAIQAGYYFNKFSSKDFGVDIMKLWMGDLDTNSGQLRSIYLGDRFKGSYTAHVAIVGLKFRF